MTTHTATGGPTVPISLANKAQYLLISRASAEDLHRTVTQRHQDTQVTGTEHTRIYRLKDLILPHTENLDVLRQK